MVEIEHKCIICGIEPEEVAMFGAYGNNPLKISDNNQYCESHFEEKDALYDACLESYSALAEPMITLEHYALTFTMASTV